MVLEWARAGHGNQLRHWAAHPYWVSFSLCKVEVVTPHEVIATWRNIFKRQLLEQGDVLWPSSAAHTTPPSPG